MIDYLKQVVANAKVWLYQTHTTTNLNLAEFIFTGVLIGGILL